jgi:hypothetical protein
MGIIPRDELQDYPKSLCRKCGTFDRTYNPPTRRNEGLEYGVRLLPYPSETVLTDRSSYAKLGLHTDAVEQSLAVAVGFAKLIERMRQQAQEEMYAASEWMKWLKYGMSTSTPFANSRNR